MESFAPGPPAAVLSVRIRLLSNAVKRQALILALFVSCGVNGICEVHWLTLGAESRVGSTFTKDARFPVKAQLDIAIAASVEFLPFESFGLGVSYGYHWTKDSNLEGGFLYRAYSGSDLRIFISTRFLSILDGPSVTLLLGSNQGALMRLDRFELTNLHFFYWGLFVHPFLEMGFTGIPLLGVQISVPFEYYFRKELDLSTSIGVGANIRLYPLRKQRS
jgi:hypothetical protein